MTTTCATFPFPTTTVDPSTAFVSPPQRLITTGGRVDVSFQGVVATTAANFSGSRCVAVQIVLTQVLPVDPCSGVRLAGGGNPTPIVLGTTVPQAPAVTLSTDADLVRGPISTRYTATVTPGTYDVVLIVSDPLGLPGGFLVTLTGVLNVLTW